jgi:NAD(P)-dependent dehydrogenase (short-subunit alcohol dehydrogenase family)
MARVNTLGTSKANRLAVAQFLKQDFDPAWGSRGKIVNVSSCAACIAFPGEVAYSATKAAINHMTRAAALDQAKDHININCVAPGVVATGMARQNIEDDAIVALMKKATPLPRLGTVEDIANAVVFLCAKESSWITGQTWAVDGGMTLGVPPA